MEINKIPIGSIILMNISKIIVVFIMLIVANYSYAENRSHVDPLEVMSTHKHEKSNKTRVKKIQKPSRHFSPLEAMKGKMVPKENVSAPNIQSRKPKKNKLKKSSVLKKRQKKIKRRPDLRKKSKVSHSADIEYTIENVEDISPNAETAGGEKRIDDFSKNALIDLGFRNKKQNSNISRQKKNDSKEGKKTKIDLVKNTINDMNFSDIGSESPSGPHNPIGGIKTTKKHMPAYHTTKNKILYLTFDDGPCGGTSNLLQLLKKEGISVTMFYIGRNVARSHKLFNKAVSMPNVLVANHTYTHANGHYRRFYSGSIKTVVDDIDKAQHLIGGVKYLRLAGRNVWRLPNVRRDDWGISVAHRSKEIDKYDALANRGYYIYGWDAEWSFSHRTQRPLFGGEEMARRVNLVYNSGKSVKKRKMILLAHDYLWKRAKDLAKLRTFIHIMRADGWKFDTIDTYSNSTPEVLTVKNNAKKSSMKLKPAQKIAKKASMMPPTGKNMMVVTKTKKSNSTQSKNSISRLCNAIRNQNFITIRKLLANGVKINKKNSNGEIPLNIAIKTNNAVLVKMLVEGGARIFNIDAYGMSPMGIARQHQNTIIIKYLINQINKQKKQKLRHTLFAMK
jgi:peptidoglycan/xylan/chitin deacetylase (PgdA/CDA1 family)